MRRIALLLVAVVIVAGVVVCMVPPSRHADGADAPIFGGKIPPGYRDWTLISVAREKGNLNDLRAKLGNDVAIKAYREGKLPFPDGTIIARLAWSYVPSEENNKAFGRLQSYVATIYRYEGVSHGFSRVGSSAYRKEAAELARDRTLAFLKQHLGSGVKV